MIARLKKTSQLYYSKFKSTFFQGGSSADIFAFGFSTAIGGQYFFWNEGLRFGFGNLIISLAIMSSAYFLLVVTSSDVVSKFPFAGGPMGIARITMGNYLAFLLSCSIAIQYIGLISLLCFKFGDIIETASIKNPINIPIIYFLFYLCIGATQSFGSDWNHRFNFIFAFISFVLLLIFIFGSISHSDIRRNAMWHQDTSFLNSTILGTNSTITIDSDKSTWLFGGIDGFLRIFPFSASFFLGVDSFNFTCNFVPKPKIQVPKGGILSILTLFLSGFIVTILYCSLPPNIQSSFLEPFPLTKGYRLIFPSLSSTHLNYLSFPALISSTWGLVFSASTVFFSLSESLFLPSVLSRLTNESNTPLDSILFTCTLSFFVNLILLNWPYLRQHLFLVCVLFAFFSYLLRSIGFIIFISKHQQVKSPFKTPFGRLGAVGASLVFLLGAVSIIFFQKDQHLSVFIFLALVCAFSCYYYISSFYLQVTVSETEKKIFRGFYQHLVSSNSSLDNEVMMLMKKIGEGGSSGGLALQQTLTMKLKIEKERMDQLANLPVHKAIFENTSEEGDIEFLIKSNPSTLAEKDYDKNTALDLALQRLEYDNMGEGLLYLLIVGTLGLRTHTSKPVPESLPTLHRQTSSNSMARRSTIGGKNIKSLFPISLFAFGSFKSARIAGPDTPSQLVREDSFGSTRWKNFPEHQEGEPVESISDPRGKGVRKTISFDSARTAGGGTAPPSLLPSPEASNSSLVISGELSWAATVQHSDVKVVAAVKRVLIDYRQYATILANALDARGRRAIDIASPECKAALTRALFLHKRYEINDGPREYQSTSTTVVLAIDHGNLASEEDQQASTTKNKTEIKSKVESKGESKHDSKGTSVQDLKEIVALKFMRNEDDFKYTRNVFTWGKFNSKFIITPITSYSPDALKLQHENERGGKKASTSQNAKNAMFAEHDKDIKNFRDDAIAKGFGPYPFCFIFPGSEMTLKRLLDTQGDRIQKDGDHIKLLAKQITQALEHMHGKFFIHGDLKPANILIIDRVCKLIDLDAAACWRKGQFAGAKYSSAYLPPEMLALDPIDESKVHVRTFKRDGQSGEPLEKQTENTRTTKINIVDQEKSITISRNFDPSNLPYSLLLANPSIDMWALGCILFQLCTRMLLFPSSKFGDHLSEDDLFDLYERKDTLIESKVQHVYDRFARNLVSLLLSKDPKLRPQATHVLSHSFITGKQPARLQGEKPLFDIFLSYRVDSDHEHAKILYDFLISNGFKVWWDKKCLSPGEDWEVGFCDGLLKSAVFVPLLSRDAINHPTLPHMNFSSFSPKSNCDNVLLEWRMAQELKERGLLSKIFPIMIGTKAIDPDTGLEAYSNYFKSGCHPICNEIVVESVEKKLREHFNRQGLGLPFFESMTVKEIVKSTTSCQGGFIEGSLSSSLEGLMDVMGIMKSALEVEQRIHNSSVPSTVKSKVRRNQRRSRDSKGSDGDETPSDQPNRIGSTFETLDDLPTHTPTRPRSYLPEKKGLNLPLRALVETQTKQILALKSLLIRPSPPPTISKVLVPHPKFNLTKEDLMGSHSNPSSAPFTSPFQTMPFGSRPSFDNHMSSISGRPSRKYNTMDDFQDVKSSKPFEDDLDSFAFSKYPRYKPPSPNPPEEIPLPLADHHVPDILLPSISISPLETVPPVATSLDNRPMESFLDFSGLGEPGPSPSTPKDPEVELQDDQTIPFSIDIQIGESPPHSMTPSTDAITSNPFDFSMRVNLIHNIRDTDSEDTKD